MLASVTRSWAVVVREERSSRSRSFSSPQRFFAGSSCDGRSFFLPNASISHLPANWSKLPQHMTAKTTNTENDRRSRHRMPVRVPVKVRHQGGEQQGLTRDLSSTGIFLYSESGMKAGSKLELVIMLPPGLGVGPGGWTLCQASVVRVEQSEGKSMGIAATLDSIALLPEI